MLSFLSVISIGLTYLLFLPTLVLASNDVTLTKSQAQLSVNGATIDIVGSDATINSIVVNSSNFEVTMSGTSTMKVNASGLQKMTVTSHTMDSVCNNSESSINIGNPSLTDATAVTIEVSTDLCGTSVAGSSGSGNSGDGGGTVVGLIGKVNDEIIGRPQIIYPDGTVVYLDEANTTQIDQAQERLSLLELPQPQIPTPSQVAQTVSPVFNRTLRPGLVHPDVKRLQQLLNTHTDTVIASSGVGSSGHETDYYGSLTTDAVRRFQAKYGVVSSGAPNTTGYGLVGPKTRAKLNEVFSRNIGSLNSTLPPKKSTLLLSDFSFNRGLGAGDTGEDVKQLQIFLNSSPDTVIVSSGVGSSGQETNYFGSLTEVAVAKFQMKHGIVTNPSDIGYGYVGPATRSKLNSLISTNSPRSAAPSTPTTPGVVSSQNGQADNLRSQIDTLMVNVRALQNKMAEQSSADNVEMVDETLVDNQQDSETYSWYNVAAISTALQGTPLNESDNSENAQSEITEETGTYKWNNLHNVSE